MLALTFGILVVGKNDVAAYNTIYVALFAAAFFTSPWDWLKLDTLFFRTPGTNEPTII